MLGGGFSTGQEGGLRPRITEKGRVQKNGNLKGPLSEPCLNSAKTGIERGKTTLAWVVKRGNFGTRWKGGNEGGVLDGVLPKRRGDRPVNST